MKAFQLQPFLQKNNLVNLLANRRITGYILLFILAAISASSLSIIRYDLEEPTIRVISFIQVAIFIILGTIHIILLEKHAIFTHYSMKEKFYFSLVLALVIYGVLLLFFFIVRPYSQNSILASSCAFLLPNIVGRSWHYLQVISENRSMVWCDFKPVVEDANLVYLNTILIHLRLSREKASFWINMPINKEFGKLFNSFLNMEQKDNTIQFESTRDNKSYGWKFFAIGFGGLYKKALNPSKSLQGNKSIKKNMTILAERIPIF